jgi:hypothetical protein
MRELINYLLQSEICQIEFRNEGKEQDILRKGDWSRIKEVKFVEKKHRKFVCNKEGVRERNNGSISIESLPATL